ncbi:hypothetical protein TSOC_004323 [Tetrabaena socialis]|uniref:HMA domain-containing protein n=1 Tax=Tetrabaena socialis TaxID=47790 RepID=A0A2J8A9A2_9CHLO|nr:hypothetical protein TSOC_004323 [Tetrabaena socialis]|eukprot:PNH09075.1 hypothetical protein TSOC_004323 [Tetrabaena socialis]
MARSLERAVFGIALLLALAANGQEVDGQGQVDAAAAVGEAAQASGEPLTIKLRPGSTRKKAEVKALAERLRQLPSLQGCAITAVSRDILVVSPTARHSTEQLKRELLLQPDVYEVEVGEMTHRREGDKPYDQVKRELLEKAVNGSQVRIRDRIRNKINQLIGRRSKDAAVDEAGDAFVAEAGAKAAKRAAKRAKRARRAKRRKEKREAAKGDSKEEVEL